MRSYDPDFPEYEDCSECGHPHFWNAHGTYVHCPIEGCNCPMDDYQNPEGVL